MIQLINDGWKFRKMPNGSIPENVADSSGWEEVELPHDWLIWQKDLYESADAWYKRILDLPDPVPPVCLIRFDGVYMDCDVYINGTLTCRHPYGYTAFTADLHGRIHPGNNEILVHIRHQSPNSRWYSGSGIYRDVTLISLPEDHIVPYSFYIATNRSDDIWNVQVSAEIHGRDGIPFEFEIRDAEGNTAAKAGGISRGGKTEAVFGLERAEEWSTEHPYLYSIQYQYGEQTGVQKFGLRSVSFDPDRGFFLNHQPMKLRGVCLHHDLGALGAAFHEKAARRQLQLMRDMGANAIRTSHNPPAEKMLELCDEMGFLVIDEAFDMWERPKTSYDYARFFDQYEEQDVASWIRRDRCHPCVIMWSIGNEIYDMHADERGAEITRMLKEQIEQHDPERHAAVTFGCNYMPWEGGQRCADIVKIAGYNYGENLYETHHRAHPDWVIYGSETASVLSSRGIYHFPIENSIMSEADYQCSALGNSNTSWGATDLKKMITDDQKCPFSMGQFIWSGVDYIGEPTPYHTRSCYFGQADTACFPKDAYYLFKSLWSGLPTLHIGVYWDWNPGQMIDVPVMTNCAEAELIVNGKSAGRKRTDMTDPDKCLPVWKILYEPGEIRAVGYDADGRIMLTDTRRTPGDPERLELSAEDPVLYSDGYDMTFVSVLARDREGNPVENARTRLHISVSGGGWLIGTDNGDSTDPDLYKSGSRRLFGGKILLMIGSNGRKEDVHVAVESRECPPSEIVIPICEKPPREGFRRVLHIGDQRGKASVPVRKIEILPLESTKLTKDHPECRFAWKTFPASADKQPVTWEITNAAGIPTPYMELTEKDGTVHVHASGDGRFYLRALTGETAGHADIISQIEIISEGIGTPALDPYRFVSAGLYDIHSGNIGTGNEKGIAFSREGESMIGFSRIDFGRSGSDCLSVPVFALDGKHYEIELFDGNPMRGGRLIQILHYEKPSIWNVYQEETYHLPERLTGVHCLCFRMKQKVHMKGFRFEKQSRAFSTLYAGEADTVYGDSFALDGRYIRDIGNNVSLVFDDMDFGEYRECNLEIRGKTPLNKNAITVRIANQNGESVTEIADFRKDGGEAQQFRVQVPGGVCTVSFVFLPGSRFDFQSFVFSVSE